MSSTTPIALPISEVACVVVVSKLIPVGTCRAINGSMAPMIMGNNIPSANSTVVGACKDEAKSSILLLVPSKMISDALSSILALPSSLLSRVEDLMAYKERLKSSFHSPHSYAKARKDSSMLSYLRM